MLWVFKFNLKKPDKQKLIRHIWVKFNSQMQKSVQSKSTHHKKSKRGYATRVEGLNSGPRSRFEKNISSTVGVKEKKPYFSKF